MTQRSFSNPSQHAWNIALQDIQAAQKADEVYNKVSKSRHCLSMRVQCSCAVPSCIVQNSQSACLRDSNNRIWGCCVASSYSGIDPQVRLAVEQHTSLLKRDAEVRVKVWMAKLNEQVARITYPVLTNSVSAITFHSIYTINSYMTCLAVARSCS